RDGCAPVELGHYRKSFSRQTPERAIDRRLRNTPLSLASRAQMISSPVTRGSRPGLLCCALRDLAGRGMFVRVAIQSAVAVPTSRDSAGALQKALALGAGEGARAPTTDRA